MPPPLVVEIGITFTLKDMKKINENNISYFFKVGSIFYIERKWLEYGLSSEIKNLKKKIENTEIEIEKEEYKDKLKIAKAKRPCVLVNVIGENVYIMPITTKNNFDHNVQIKPLQLNPDRQRTSYIKAGSLIRFEMELFKKINHNPTPGIRKYLDSEEMILIKEKFLDIFGN